MKKLSLLFIIGLMPGLVQAYGTRNWLTANQHFSRELQQHRNTRGLNYMEGARRTTIHSESDRTNWSNGGNLRNAIAREASAVVLVPNTVKEEVRAEFNMFFYEIQREYKTTEPNIKMKMGTVDTPDFVIDEKSQSNLLNAIYACPHGVIEMSREIPGLVETSTNLASIKMRDDKIVIETSQRSSVESAKRDVANMVESVFLLAGARVKHGDGYPGWTPNTDSEILRISKEAYEDLFEKEPVVRAIHAGLECGLFLEKYPGLDMISFGPTLRGVHSPDERINIETVEKFWKHLLEVLRRIPEKK